MDMLLILLSGVFVGYIFYTQEKNMSMFSIFKIYIILFATTIDGLAIFEYITWNIAMILIIINGVICLLAEFFYKKLNEKSEK